MLSDEETSTQNNAILGEPIWSLLDVLAWVAIRDSDAIALARSSTSLEVALEVWIYLHPESPRFADTVDGAWKLLASKMTNGLTAFATQRQKSQLQAGLETFFPGRLFPPADAPGAPLEFRPEIQDDGEVILVPEARPLLRSWHEMTDLRFRREMVVAAFARSNEDPSPSLSLPLERTQQKPQQQRTEAVLKRLYPDGLPGRDKVTDAQLFSEVSKGFRDEDKKSGTVRQVPGRDTILRAAGRRRK